ncbi:hypothetical protein C0J52_12036 [Blattella germanica]|nr:hypothetical protein C0J52_12036 [Blattella germanica]
MEFKEEETDAAKRLSAKEKPRWSSLAATHFILYERETGLRIEPSSSTSNCIMGRWIKKQLMG